MFNFSQLPFSTALVLFFNGGVTDEIILNTRRNEDNILDIKQVNNIVLQVKRTNPIIL
jgi:hypothetical protein